jgi:hypothetical protein
MAAAPATNVDDANKILGTIQEVDTIQALGALYSTCQVNSADGNPGRDTTLALPTGRRARSARSGSTICANPAYLVSS